MNSHRPLTLAVILLAVQLLGPSLFAATWSSAAWTGDATSNIISGNTVWAYHFGTAETAAVNGVSVPGIATSGAIPSTTQFSLSASPVFSTDTNNLTAAGGSGSAVMAGGYVLPSGTSNIITLRGLTEGQDYVASFYGMGIDAEGVRDVTFSVLGVSQTVNENAFGENNGIRVDYAFTATTATRFISLLDEETGKDWALVALALRTKIQPTIGAISDQSIYENATTDQIPLTLNGENPNAFSYTITSDNPTLVPADAYSLGGDGSGGGQFLLVTPAANQNGTAVITVQVNDGSATASTSFTLTVNPVNSPPDFSLIGGPPITSAGDVWTAPGQSYNYFTGFTSSPNADKLLALGPDDVNGGSLLYTSTDFGASWSTKEISGSPRPSLSRLASSADGVKLAATSSGESIYISADAGTTWTKRASPLYWSGIASSADGTKLAAAVAITQDSLGNSKPAQIYTSSNSGLTWTARGPKRFWQCIASSADGTILVAGDTDSETTNDQPYDGHLYVSTNSGLTWTARGPDIGWKSVAVSADGTKLVAGAESGSIFTSTDSGLTWTERDPQGSWTSVTISSDGKTMAGSSLGGSIVFSNDSGETWNEPSAPPDVDSIYQGYVISSADGKRMAISGSKIYTSIAPPGPFSINANSNSGPYTAGGITSNFSPGPVDESAQALTSFIVSNDNEDLFSVQPSIANDGTLSFTPSTSFGSAIVSVIAQDDGGTANGGVDTSEPKTFTINVLPNTNANLSSLALSSGELSPAFTPETKAYSATVDSSVTALTVTPAVAQVSATVQVKINSGSFGSADTPLPLSLGLNKVTVLVTAQDGVVSNTYTLLIHRQLSLPTSTDITASSVTLSADVSSDTDLVITERGFVYARTSTNAAPLVGGPGVFRVSAVGTTGAFTLPVTSLLSSTSYSYRSYSTNGGYSPVMTFTTLAALPRIQVSESSGTAIENNTTFAFGDAAIGATKTRTLIIRNTGIAPLTGLTASLVGANAAEFTVGNIQISPRILLCSQAQV
ncbi:cadherin-like protein [Prosthecobacter fusiformis]|uniref:Cadherin-like protein n=1 Tax=Prosthecobacter fusiformis TaxID=48464 RepID=A0A4R7SQI0_9BACT|nr:cadherin-like beta sandwich domain-containing protein [Prosthecobacter fusiformis]TDU81204.1 cadherin-like protein [Prosthecobacter fusiformis]